MKKCILLILASLATSTQAFTMEAFVSEGSRNCFGFDSITTIGVGGGYRQDCINWKTLPNSPTIDTSISESWKNVSMGVVEVGAQVIACDHYLVGAYFDYGLFDNSGSQHVKDHSLTTPSLSSSSLDLTSDLHAKTKGHAYDLSGGVGYQFHWNCYQYALTPLIGWNYSFQKFVNSKYSNALDPNAAVVESHNKYRFRWNGPFFGFSTAFHISCDWQVAFTYAFHWAKYQMKIHENFAVDALRGNQHCGNIIGNEFNLSTSYQFCEDWLLAIDLDYKEMSGSKGKMHFESGSAPLRNLNWTTWSASVDVAYLF